MGMLRTKNAKRSFTGRSSAAALVPNHSLHRVCISIAALVSCFPTAVFAQSWTLQPLTSFGVNGWLSGTAFGVSGTNNDIRSMAYNPSTGNLLVATGTSLRIVNGTTGSVGVHLSNSGVTGGTRALNTVTVMSDGVIYGSNLTTSSSSSVLKIYRWANEGETPSTFYSGNGGFSAGVRAGDSLTSFGNDGTGRLIFGTGTTAGTPTTYFGVLFTNGGASGSPVAMTGTAAGNQSFRTGLAVVDADTVLGLGAGSTTNNALVSGNVAPWTFDGVRTIANANERSVSAVTPVFENTIFSKSLLATVQIGSTGTNTVRIYDATNISTSNLASPLVTANIALTNISNGNGSVGIGFGTVDGRPVLYAMNTNNGIQAFEIVPETSTWAMLPAGIAACGGGAYLRSRSRRRRRAA